MRPAGSRGEVIEARCTQLDQRGAGVASLTASGGQALRVHVAGALPGEKVRARLEHRSAHRPEAWAALEEVLEAAPERVAPACPAHGRCGGCVLQHLDYPAQVAWKGRRVAEVLGGWRELRGVPVLPCVESPRPFGYRNQAKYVYGPVEGGRPALAAYEPRSHTLVDMAGCRLVEPPIDAVAGVLRALLAARGVAPFDERRRTGFLRYVVIRCNEDGESLVTLVAATRSDSAEGLARALRAEVPAVTGVVLNLNDSGGNVLFGAEELLLDGRPTIGDRVGRVRVELASRSFFQINRHVAALAYRRLEEAAARLGPLSLVLDVYAGAGTIAATLAPHAREVVAIEENAAATEAAARFARGEGLDTVRFVTGDAGAQLAAVAEAELVVLNPPRAGCAPAVLAEVARLRPRLVGYLSCNPETLARDLAVLTRPGGELAVAEVTPLDMLPHTPHVEALALLAPAKRALDGR